VSEWYNIACLERYYTEALPCVVSVKGSCVGSTGVFNFVYVQFAKLLCNLLTKCHTKCTLREVNKRKTRDVFLLTSLKSKKYS
jgi:hypothetical protein